MEVRGGKGREAYVKFTMHSKDKEDKKMHSKGKKEEIAREDDNRQPAEVEAEEIKEEEKLIKREEVINLVRDSDDSDSEDMLVPEVLMNLATDSYDSDTEDMPLLLQRILF